jgi:hypothetical protein
MLRAFGPDQGFAPQKPYSALRYSQSLDEKGPTWLL